jgi:hypothetical protein
MFDPHMPRRPWPRLTEPEPARRTPRGFIVLVAAFAVSALGLLALAVWAVYAVTTK